MTAPTRPRPAYSLDPDWRGQIRAALQHKSHLDTRSIFHELNPHLKDSPIVPPGTKMRPAAVLFPIIERAALPTVLFTVRSKEMPSHAGQISFPGGRAEKGDENRVATALREAEEEVGIMRETVEVIGDMGIHIGGKGFEVTPVIGVVHPDTNFEPCPREVDDIFEVPLEHLFDRRNHIVEQRKAGDITYRMPAIPYEDYHIWGLTAGIIHSLARTIDDWVD